MNESNIVSWAGDRSKRSRLPVQLRSASILRTPLASFRLEFGVQTGLSFELSILKKVDTTLKATIETRYIGGGIVYSDKQSGLIIETILHDQWESTISSFSPSIKTTITTKLVPVEKR